VTTLAVEVGLLFKAAKTVARGAKLVKSVNASKALQARFDESVVKVNREMGQVAFAVCKAFVALALQHEPTAPEVEHFMNAAADDPAFPHRAYRLLGELRRSASHRRRAFLASVLFGLPFTKLPDDERDRVDMAVERMMPEDVELLRLIVEKDRTGRPSPEPGGPYLFKDSRVVALTRGIEVRVATTDDCGDDGEFSNEIYADPRFCVDRGAFGSLRSLGLVEFGTIEASQGEWQIHPLLITPLGRITIRAIEEVRPGFDATAVP
jgi:hypothetical protein